MFYRGRLTLVCMSIQANMTSAVQHTFMSCHCSEISIALQLPVGGLRTGMEVAGRQMFDVLAY